MSSFQHLTPRYLRDRISLLIYERFHPEVPWLTRQAIELLDSWLNVDDVGLEFGSGRSTRWFASRVKQLTSVEDDFEWFSTVQKQIAHYENVDYRLCHEKSHDTLNSDYIDVIKDFPSASLDFCLIDGIARDHCALASLDKIKPGGILIIDDVERYIPRKHCSHAPMARSLKDGYETDIWRQVGEQLTKWRCIWTTDGVTDTAIWVKQLT